MPETINVLDAVGAGPTYSTIAAARLLTDDLSSSTDTTYPIPIPADDTDGWGGDSINYSYWKHFALELEGDGWSQINNVRMYSDGAIGWNYGDGGSLFVGGSVDADQGCPLGSYDQATGTQSVTGDPMFDATSGHSFYNIRTQYALSGWTSGSPGTIDSSDYTTSPDTTNFAVLQVAVSDNATYGTQTPETVTWMYDIQ